MNVSRKISYFLKYFTAIALSLLFTQTAFTQSSENQKIVVEGSLTDSGGNAIDLSGAALVFYVMNDQNCYLYGEWSSNAGDGQGNISHRLGGSTMVVGSPNTFTQNLFFGAASGKNISTDSACTVAAADTRIVQVYYQSQDIRANIQLGTVPYAHNATTLNGKTATDFLEVTTDSNTLFYGGASGQVLTRAAGGLTWTTPASAASVTSSSVTTALGYTPANSATLSNYAVRSNNLSDLTSATTARTNLGLGTLATKNSVDLSTAEVTGTLPSTRLPAMSGDITNSAGSGNFTVIRLRNIAVASATPSSGQVLAYDGAAWTPTSVPAGVGTVTNVMAGSGLLGGPITSSGTLSVNFGTSAGTVAQGNDSRILGALQSVNNLSEISSAPIARSNLGLGSLSTKSSINLATDVTGVLSVANGGTQWSSNASGVATTLNASIGSGTIYANIGLAVTAPNYANPLAGYFNNTASDGNGVKINVENTSASKYGLRVTTASGLTTHFVVLNNGNVGIGTATPEFKLTLSGTALTDRKIGINGTPVMYLPDQAASAFTGSLFVGNGGANLSHASGQEGYYNTGVGINALNSNTTGSSNVANGYKALYSNTTGFQNVSNGFFSLQANVNGSNNNAYGAHVLSSNSSGSGNVANGYAAMNSNTTGNDNVAIGMTSLYGNNTGNNNTAVGTNALYNSTGSNNIAIGSNAGKQISAGSYNVVIGSNDGGSISGQSNNILLSDGQGNERVRINSNGDVGLGTIAPSSRLHVYGPNTEIARFDGANAGGYIAFSRNSSPKGFIGYASGSGIFFTNEIADAMAIRSNNAVQLGSGNAAHLTVTPSGQVGIGTTTPSAALTVSGSIRTTAAVEFGDGTVQNSAAFSSYERISNNCSAANSCQATCSTGKKVIAGGCINTIAPSSASALISSFPASDTQWSCQWGATGGLAVTAWAICVKF